MNSRHPDRGRTHPPALAGAERWVATNACGNDAADVELRDVERLFTENDLWPTVFGLDS